MNERFMWRLAVLVWAAVLAFLIVCDFLPRKEAEAQPPAAEPVPVACIIPAAKAAPVQEPEAALPEPTFSERDLELLALVIYQEAGADYCSDETRLMVGTVVMNRVADSRYPNTIDEVLTQRAQYGRLYWTGLVWPERASQEVEAHAVERAYACAERVLEGERALPADVIFQSEYIQGDEIVAHQDGFYFCR